MSPSPPSASNFSAEALVPNGQRICRWIRQVAVLIGLVVGISNLLVWVLGAVPQISFLPPIMVVRINNATAITAAALSLGLWGEAPGAGRRWLAQGFALVPLLIGALTAFQDLSGAELGIDQLLSPGTIPGDVAAATVRHPGRMSLNAALSLTLLGLALVGMEWRVSLGGKKFWWSPGCAVLATLPVTLGMVGYLVGITKFTGILRSTNILLHAAIALFSLCLGVLAARPMRPPVVRILSAGADGVLLRWMLPGSAAIMLTLGWIVGQGRQAGMVAPGEGAAMMLYGGLVLLFALLIVASQAVGRQELQARSAAAALSQGEERSRAIIDTALDAVLLMDVGGIIVDWNPAAERIFGWSREEVIGRSLAECIIPEELRAAHASGMRRLLATGQNTILGKRLELPALRRDGTRMPMELSINRLPGPELSLFVGFMRDITERQAAEEKLRTAKEAAEAASRAKDHFVAALSHELRTPLTPVLLSAAALREDERLPDDVRAQMAMMERSIALEARLIDDLLDLTRISRGKLLLRREACDTHSLLGHAAEIVREDARAKDIALDLKLTASRYGVTGDSARLQQVFWNLLKNSVKFSAAGGRITIQTRDDAEHGRLVIEVGDTGLGFDPAAAEQIFQPFEQAGREGDHRLGGLGLGLSIVRAIVDLHGGTVRASSPGLGLGATFSVEFPDPIEPPHGMLMADTRRPASDSASPARRILLVEDHEPTLGVLQRLLTRAGHQIIPASSVAAACAAAETHEFDVLISDLGLPDGTGLDLIAALRARRPDFPAIAISGFGMEEDLNRTRAAGFAKHLVKPVNFDELRDVLQKLPS